MPGKLELEKNETKREAWLSMCVECQSQAWQHYKVQLKDSFIYHKMMQMMAVQSRVKQQSIALENWTTVPYGNHSNERREG